MIDAGTQSVLRYHADGTPDDFSALGTNVLEGVTGECTENHVLEVAVDNSGGATDGNVYVTQYCGGATSAGSRIHIYSSTGSHLGDLTQWNSTNYSGVCGVAVDPTGAVYVSEENGIHKYVPSGSAPVNEDNTANFTGVGGCDQLAAGAGPTAGYIFAVPTRANSSNWTARAAKSSTRSPRERSRRPWIRPPGYVYAVKENSFQAYDASGAVSAALAVEGPIQRRSRNRRECRDAQRICLARTVGKRSHRGLWAGSAGRARTARTHQRRRRLRNVQVGGSIYCEPGSWNGEPTFSYQWLRDGARDPRGDGIQLHARRGRRGNRRRVPASPRPTATAARSRSTPAKEPSTSRHPAARPPPPTSRHAGPSWNTSRNTTMPASSTATSSTTTARQISTTVVVTTIPAICTRLI